MINNKIIIDRSSLIYFFNKHSSYNILTKCYDNHCNVYSNIQLPKISNVPTNKSYELTTSYDLLFDQKLDNVSHVITSTFENTSLLTSIVQLPNITRLHNIIIPKLKNEESNTATIHTTINKDHIIQKCSINKDRLITNCKIIT